ncbi:MAG: hypothetical protein HKP61_16615 [Dactylosporangium sp.]|nr:hypothetical protein [Dactylosporangium sp.]NNJ62530.1 hypothetical protein [Dactylosporangium sp.]
MTVMQPRVVPRDGLANPVFDGMGREDDLIVSLTFAPGLTDAQVRLVLVWIREVERSWQPGDPGTSPFAAGEPFVHEQQFHARISGLPDSRRRVRSLIDDLVAGGVRIHDGFFACWRPNASGVLRPRPDPRAPQETSNLADLADYADRLWNPDLAPPPSEVAAELTGGFLVSDELVVEHRGSPLYLPGLRIGYGLLSCDHVPADRRTEEVRAALIAAVKRRWLAVFKAPGREGTRPLPRSQAGGADRIDTIVAGSRRGYSCTIDAAQLLDRPSPTTCRYREYELMEALLDTVDAAGLAPVITWRRFSTPVVLPPLGQPVAIVLQLWEQTTR